MNPHFRAASYRNDAPAAPYRDYRALRRVQSGREHDPYDGRFMDTRSVVLHRGGRALAGLRITRFRGTPRFALSFRMWGEALQNLELPGRFRRDFDAGRMVDLTELCLSEGAEPGLAFALLGAALAETGGKVGAYLTATPRLEALLKFAGVPFMPLHRGLLKGRPRVLLAIPPAAWGCVHAPAARAHLSIGARAMEPALAHRLPFYRARRAA